MLFMSCHIRFAAVVAVASLLFRFTNLKRNRHKLFFTDVVVADGGGISATAAAEVAITRIQTITRL